MTQTAYSGWAKVELLGHRVRIGKISEAEIYGGKMLRIDLPTEGGDQYITEYYGSASIYAICPISEEIGNDYATRSVDPRPVNPNYYRRAAIESQTEDYENEFGGDDE